MNKLFRRAIKIFLLYLLMPFTAKAYEISTHILLSEVALQKSVLSQDPKLLASLGLPQRDAQEYFISNGAKRNLQATATFGAEYEDTQYSRRPFNHFFDPQFNHYSGRGLELHVASGHPSPDWAIEDIAAVSDLKTSMPQQYSFRSGQRDLYSALTAASPAQRVALFSKVFQTLGHITHHIQDMAQPQHVRNDQHIHFTIPLAEIKIEPEWSYFERYTEANVNGRIDAILNANPYPIPGFSTARQFWHTKGTDRARFVGMAEFTAQNYVSFGAQYAYGGTAADGREIVTSHRDYALPGGANRDGSVKSMSTEKMTVRLTDGSSITGSVDFLKGSVVDEQTNEVKAGRRLASPSIVNMYLENEAIQWSVYTENSGVYEDAYPILFPRAVAFSAGLINHFFRGRIDFKRDPNGKDWQLANVGTQAMNGSFAIYAEDAAGNRSPLPSAQFSKSLAAGQTTVINFPAPPVGTVKLIAAFRGQIGAEGDATLASGFYATAGKVIGYEASTEIIIVGATAIDTTVNSRRAFRWSSRSGMRVLQPGAGGVTSEAFGVSGDGNTVVGITTGYTSGGITWGGLIDQIFRGGTPNSFSAPLDVATRWKSDDLAYYLNGGSNTYSQAWTANADGSRIYGEGFVPLNTNATLSLTWSASQLISIAPARGVFARSGLISSDKSINLTRIGSRAAYVKDGVTTVIPLPMGHDWSEARQVVVIKQ
jgi:hypothetical protein